MESFTTVILIKNHVTLFWEETNYSWNRIPVEPYLRNFFLFLCVCGSNSSSIWWNCLEGLAKTFQLCILTIYFKCIGLALFQLSIYLEVLLNESHLQKKLSLISIIGEAKMSITSGRLDRQLVVSQDCLIYVEYGKCTHIVIASS